MPASKENSSDLDLLTTLAKQAGSIGLKWFGEDPKVWMKEGQSPVSEADLAIDDFLKDKLLDARPNYGWLSEETDDDEERLNAKRVFVVDPIDGTRGFISGHKQWCVSIAVVENNRPVVGILECPALGQTITASLDGGSWCNGSPIRSRSISNNQTVFVTGPRSFLSSTEKFVGRNFEKLPFVPSLAYRIAMIAKGDADVSLARASAKDWDLAAADLIASEAGARLSDIDGNVLRYNCHDVRHGTLVASAHNLHDEMLEIASRALDKQIN